MSRYMRIRAALRAINWVAVAALLLALGAVVLSAVVAVMTGNLIPLVATLAFAAIVAALLNLTTP